MKLIDLLVQELPKRGGWPEGALNATQDKDGDVCFSAGAVPEFGCAARDAWGGGDWCGNEFFTITASDYATAIITREQYEAALEASDGWIEWGGGECPVDEHVMVEYKVRSSDDVHYSYGRHLRWWHDRDWQSGDIIAYRLHKPDINSLASDDRLEQDLNECIGQDIDMPEWSGNGLPPVGIKCEFVHGPYSVEEGGLTGIIPKVGEVVEVVAHRLTSDNSPVAVVYWDNNGAGRSACFVEGCFRPLRTEAERAREKLAASLHIAAGASPIELNGIEPLYFKLADAIISGSVFGATFKENK